MQVRLVPWVIGGWGVEVKRNQIIVDAVHFSASSAWNFQL